MLYTNLLHANEYILPSGVDSNIDGVEVRCYDLEEYKTVAHIYASYMHLSAENGLYLNKIYELSGIIENKDGLLDITRQELSIAERINSEYAKQAGNEESFTARFKRTAPWVLVVLETAALSVVTVMYAVK